MRVKTTQKGITSRIARCHDCRWSSDDYKTALADARDHTKIMRHETSVETATVRYFKYDGSHEKTPNQKDGQHE